MGKFLLVFVLILILITVISLLPKRLKKKEKLHVKSTEIVIANFGALIFISQ